MLGSAAGLLGGRLHNISPPFELTEGLRGSGSDGHPTRRQVKLVHKTVGASGILQRGSSSRWSNSTALGPKSPKNSKTKT